MSQRHSDLIAWQRADDLFIEMHRLARRFPAEERFELASQLRRSSFSVPANIVEGFARRKPKDRAHFLNIAESSLAEVAYCLHVAHRLEYIGKEEYARLDAQARQVAAPLVGLIQSVSRLPE